MSATEQPRRAIPIRHPQFDFDAEIPRHFAFDNALVSHFFNAIQLTFPIGERFFIRAVHDLLPQIDDSELIRQARNFAGQEAVHGNEHERYFDNLRKQGYEIDDHLRRFRRFVAILDRLPASVRIAITAGLEHHTATLGYHALATPIVRKFHPTMRALVYWHASEEVEHKSVSYDVMQAAGVGYITRVAAFCFATLAFLGWGYVGARMLLRQDRISRSQMKVLRAEVEGMDDLELVRETRQRIVAYFRRDFHPDQQDDLELAHRRLGEIGLLESTP